MELPDGDVESTGHTTHASNVVALVALEYLPVTHATHAVAPVAVEYAPAGHGDQSPLVDT